MHGRIFQGDKETRPLMSVSPNFVVFVSTLSRLFCISGSYSPPQTVLMHLSRLLDGEGKATWRGEKGRGRKGREEWP